MKLRKTLSLLKCPKVLLWTKLIMDAGRPRVGGSRSTSQKIFQRSWKSNELYWCVLCKVLRPLKNFFEVKYTILLANHDRVYQKSLLVNYWIQQKYLSLLKSRVRWIPFLCHEWTLLFINSTLFHPTRRFLSRQGGQGRRCEHAEKRSHHGNWGQRNFSTDSTSLHFGKEIMGTGI